MARLTDTTEEHRAPAPIAAFALAAAGALATYALLQVWSAMATAEQPLLWWAGRALGVVAYATLWLSMVCGTLITSGGAGGRISKKWLMDFHQESTLAALIATVLHVVVLVTHAESGVTPWAAIVPFASERLTGAATFGTIAGMGLAVIAVSSWMRTRIPYAAWRAIHALAFGVMILAIMHSVTAGTDSGTALARWLYLATAVTLAATTALRVVTAIAARRPAASHARPA